MTKMGKAWLGLLAASFVLMIICFVAPAYAKQYQVSIESYDAFRSQTIGNQYDIDDEYGYQCWDGAALLWQQLGRGLSTGGTKGAHGCWDVESARNQNAGSDFLLIYNFSDVKRGDVVVMLNSTENQYGHICFADEDYQGTVKLKIYGQNQNGNSAFSVMTHHSIGNYFLGAFRFKRWSVDAHPAIASASIVGVTTNGYTISVTAKDDRSLKSIGIRSWNDVIGKDAAKYQSANVSGETANAWFEIKVSDLGGYQNTIYHTEIWAIDSADQYSLDLSSLDITIETVKPVVTAARIENNTSSSFDVVASGTDNTTMYKIVMRVKYEGMPDDQVIWEESGPFTSEGRFHVDTSVYPQLKNKKSIVHVWAVDLCTNWSEGVKAGEVVLEDEHPVLTSATIVGKDYSGYTVKVCAADEVGLQSIGIRSWNDVIGKDAAVYQSKDVSGTAAETVFTVSKSELGGAENTQYHTEVWAIDTSGQYSIESITLDVTLDSVHTHSLTAHSKVDATCTTAGTKAYWRCELCGKLFSNSNGTNEIAAPIEIPATGHTLTAHAKVDSDCANTGTEAYWSCDVCGLLFSDRNGMNEIEAPVVITTLKDHTEETVPALAPTEWKTGYLEWSRCSVCGKEIRKKEVIPALRNMKVLYLPKGVTAIEDEAFGGVSCQAVIIPEGCETIGESAFAGCENLIYVLIPSSVEDYPENAFEGCRENMLVDRKAE